MSNSNNEQPGRSYKLPFLVFLAIGAFFLWTEHQAHVIEYLPFALLFTCVGMHFFMHGSHGGHGSHNHQAHDEPDTIEPPALPVDVIKSVSNQSDADRRRDQS